MTTFVPLRKQVLDKSTLVFVAVLPAQAEEVLSGLTWRPDHRIISLMAGVPVETVAGLAKGVESVTCAVPLPPVKVGPSIVACKGEAVPCLFFKKNSEYAVPLPPLPSIFYFYF